uniref:Uncharacterized protein n=1 Tax=Plectus sambesii TaxID=2011161 RepID=A0A914XGL3_9BILA
MLHSAASEIHENSTFLCYDVASAQRVLKAFIEANDEHDDVPELWQIWGIGMFMVTVTAFASSVGLLFLPCLSKKTYSRFLTVLGGLGVGCLSGTVLFVMIPETFHLKELGSHDFAVKSCMVAGGIYFLFLTDKVLKIYIEYRKTEQSTGMIGKIIEQLAGERQLRGKSSRRPTAVEETISMTSVSGDQNRRIEPKHQKITEKAEDENSAHMVLFGNLVINFVDGLTMGAAFGNSLIRGLSVSASIIATQFPQEITDLAILIDLGIGLRRALMLNMIPAILSYLGFASGVLLDKVAHDYGDAIFAVASGMYLYIVLSALIPEMNEKVLKELKTNRGEGVVIAILQMLFIVLGLCLILFLSDISGDITFD